MLFDKMSVGRCTQFLDDLYRAVEVRPSLKKNGRRNVRKLERQLSARYTES